MRYRPEGYRYPTRITLFVNCILLNLNMVSFLGKNPHIINKSQQNLCIAVLKLFIMSTSKYLEIKQKVDK